MDTLVKEDFCRYNDDYESVWWPRLRKFRVYTDAKREHKRSKLIRVLHSVKDYIVYDICKDWLFDFAPYGNWSKEVSPSFPHAFKAITSNFMVFLTPWYKIRRKFLNGFINCNGSKLLDNDYCSAYIRNRKEECAYYTLTFTGFHYKLVKKVIRDNAGNAKNAFVEGVSLALDPNKTDEEKQEEANSYIEEKKVVCTGWVFGWNSAIRELNKIAYLTQDLEWWSYTNWKKNNPKEVAEIENACVISMGGSK